MKKITAIAVIGLVVIAALYAWGTSRLERRLTAAVREAGIAVHRVSVGPAWGSLFRGRPGLEMRLDSPELSLLFTKEQVSGVRATPLQAAARGRFPIVQVKVRDGRATILDRTLSPEVTWALKGVEAAAALEKAGEVAFQARGLVDGGANATPAAFGAEGNAALPEGPIDAVVTLDHPAIADLAPYVRQVLGAAPDRGRIQAKCRVTLHGGVLMSHNDVTATGVVFPSQDPTVLGPDGNRLVHLLQDRDGSLHLSFIVTGELGKGLDWSDLGTGAMREALQQAMARGIQSVLSDTENQPVEDAVRRGLDSLGR